MVPVAIQTLFTSTEYHEALSLSTGSRRPKRMFQSLLMIASSFAHGLQPANLATFFAPGAPQANATFFCLSPLSLERA
jgi:hypothetical protein